MYRNEVHSSIRAITVTSALIIDPPVLENDAPIILEGEDFYWYRFLSDNNMFERNKYVVERWSFVRSLGVPLISRKIVWVNKTHWDSRDENRVSLSHLVVKQPRG